MNENDNRITEVTINWNRCIHIDTRIDEALVKKLMPQILSLRQESNAPITVALNSPGGSVAAAETLLNLITGAHQDRAACRAITVVLNKAQSAAANLLAAGHYSVALPNSEILFHDVRYGGLDDVTPTAARAAAAQLQAANDELALRLANRIFRRLVWNYIDLHKQFQKINTEFAPIHGRFTRTVNACKGANANVDIASFATALFAKLSKESDSFIEAVMHRLWHWGVITGIALNAADYRAKGQRTPGLLDGCRNLFKTMRQALGYKEGDAVWNKLTPDFKLFQTLLIENAVKEKSPDSLEFISLLESATDDYKLIKSINDPSHIRTATTQLLRHKHVFFSEKELEELDSGNDAAREAALLQTIPTAKFFWHFCVLLCRELFNGEHVLTPADAQLLGIVDEVGGGGPIESRREFWAKNMKTTK